MLCLKKGVPLSQWRPSVLPAGAPPLNYLQDTVRRRSEMTTRFYNRKHNFEGYLSLTIITSTVYLYIYDSFHVKYLSVTGCSFISTFRIRSM